MDGQGLMVVVGRVMDHLGAKHIHKMGGSIVRIISPTQYGRVAARVRKAVTDLLGGVMLWGVY